MAPHLLIEEIFYSMVFYFMKVPKSYWNLQSTRHISLYQKSMDSYQILAHYILPQVTIRASTNNVLSWWSFKKCIECYHVWWLWIWIIARKLFAVQPLWDSEIIWWKCFPLHKSTQSQNISLLWSHAIWHHWIK